MRYFLLAATLILSPGNALASTFDLSLDEANGERTVVVARPNGGAFSVAIGGKDLTVLTGEDADRARALLKKVGTPGDEAADDGALRKKKIVIHKMSVDDESADAPAEGGGEVEVRILRKSQSGPREESGLPDSDTLLTDPQPKDPERTDMRQRVLRLIGADAAEAIKFIDDTQGLDAGEKAAMKAAVGL